MEDEADVVAEDAAAVAWPEVARAAADLPLVADPAVEALQAAVAAADEVVVAEDAAVRADAADGDRTRPLSAIVPGVRLTRSGLRFSLRRRTLY